MTDRLVILAEQCGVDVATLSEWLDEQLIVLSDDAIDDEMLERVRRIRRLTTLGVNLPGVEMILYMRTQILDYQTRLGQLETEMRQLQRQYEADIARLMREYSG
ncbi:MAG TPA: MerR family transcriptional regulator [Aggregatilineales bacterium]|nr:MerR family transcriptional regulator [Aggregatilineales bacterium]